MKKDKITCLSFILFILSALFFLYRNIKGLGYLQFTDESGHFLGAIAIHHGDRLYGEYMDAHGPLVYMLSWLVGLGVGFHEVWLLRLVSTFCAVCATLAIFYSDLFQYWWQRYLATAVWLGMLANVWVVQGLYLNNYWTIGGALTVTIMAVLMLPLLFNHIISKKRFFLGGFALILLPFAAYPFSLITLVFAVILISLWFIHYRSCLVDFTMISLGGLTAFVIMILWLSIYADIGGLIAYHFVLNQTGYIHYMAFGFKHFIQSLIPIFAPYFIVETIAICTFFLGSVFLLWSCRYRFSAFFLLLGILTLQLRGYFEFQNGAFLMASLALLSMTMIKGMVNRPLPSIFLAVCLIGVTGIGSWYAISSPSGQTAEQRHHTTWSRFHESNDAVSKTIRYYTKPDERILAIPYSPDTYIRANRLSMKKYHEFLPWEADYAKHPWHGYVRNICVDLPKDEPPVIYFDHWNIWGIYPPEEFMGCVLDILKRDYIRLSPSSYVYVRKDRYFQKVR